MAKLETSTKKAAITLSMAQSMIGKTQSEIVKKKNVTVLKELYCYDNDPSPQGFSLRFELEGIIFYCYFPTQDICRWVTVSINSEDVADYQTYCTTYYVTNGPETAWRNEGLNNFITIFKDGNKGYVLGVVGLCDRTEIPDVELKIDLIYHY